MPDTLHSIATIDDLLDWLGEELDWPIEGYDLEDLTFEYDADDLGLKEEEAEKLADGSIRQLRPLEGGQPFGIFFVEFSGGRLPVVVLRRILNALVVRKRSSANPGDRQRWNTADLIFISAFGEDDNREIAFAHFHTIPDTTEIPVLHVLGWSGSNDTRLKLAHVADVLKQRLRWPEDTANHDAWRAQWTGVFRRRPGHVIRTASDLAETLAVFARKIRDAATTIMAHESETKGQLRKLHRAFKSALIHDLSEEDFADMYAQTVTYGLLTTAISRTERSEGRHGTALTLDDITAMIPVTNPFLKEMLQEFLTVGGRSGGVDFDELGINEVVELLRGDETDLPAILRDFGSRKPGEDPVIYFYEEFLRAYNAKLKIERGVFYTPQAVVSYIVRSVHELLQTEFGLEDGLASTITWGETLEKHPNLKLPPLTDLPDETKTISPDEPFVQILDPATGTATFLVEVIDVVHKHLSKKWQAKGWDAARRKDAWNAYVPKHLLPRLHGYELMMAPYAIAHMKIGLKLAETGYRFDTEERARIYLTNALEPWQEQLILPDFGALAHEALAVSEIKRSMRFTVVIGNPPYSKISSNLTPEMRAIVERYRYLDGQRIKERGALQFEINLQDDYVKFFRLCEERISKSGRGLLGLITNRGYLSTPTLRGMRDSLLETFGSIWVLDLHGHLADNGSRHDGAKEENIFDIAQGVSCFLGTRATPKIEDGSILHAERYGSRIEKYTFLQSHSFVTTDFSEIKPHSPFYLFIPHGSGLAQEWKNYISLDELFPRNSAGIITARDALVIAGNEHELAQRIERFSRSDADEQEIYEEYGFSASKRFNLRQAQNELRKLESFFSPIRRILHRPFDERFIFFHPDVVWSLSRPMADQMRNGDNLGLIATRQVTRPQFEHAYISRHMIEIKACSHDRNTQIFPLFISDELGPSRAKPNFNASILSKFAKNLSLKLNKRTREIGQDDEMSPLRLLYFVYSILYAPSYRSRYFEYLRSDFPRIPLNSNITLFRELTRLGGELVALHLLESPVLDTPRTNFVGSNRQIRKAGWTPDAGGTVWIDGKGTKKSPKPGTSGFCPVPEEVWNFHIGGYQVCEKWLKDRGPKSGNPSRTLTDEDITHYQKMVTALAETIRLMAEIDELIEFHGGWPDAFVTSDETED